MSRATATVTYPDGTVKYGIYNGTVDIFCRHLFDTPEEAWAYWDEYKKADYDSKKWDSREPEQQQIYDVVLRSFYGSGSTYKGRATKYTIEGSYDTDDLQQIKE
jgi:hypothetical protein